MATLHYDKLVLQDAPIGQRYQAVFQLKNIGSDQAIVLLMKAYTHCGSSVLLKHQLLYALGQLPKEKYPLIKNYLIQKVNNTSENSLSRHEAAEALANYFDENLQKLYQEHLNSECKQLKWTCQIAIQKVRNKKEQNLYGKMYHQTKEPAAPFQEHQFISFLDYNQLGQIYKEKRFLGLLLEQKIPLFEKYRIMYYMRNLNTDQCRKTLCQLLSKNYFQTQTSLLKHQICFIIGQIGCQNYEHLIRECLENDKQQDIVRHQALAAVASQSKDTQYLQRFIKHPSQLIRESAQVAIHTIKYWNE